MAIMGPAGSSLFSSADEALGALRSECPSKNSRMRTSSSNAYRPMPGKDLRNAADTPLISETSDMPHEPKKRGSSQAQKSSDFRDRLRSVHGRWREIGQRLGKPAPRSSRVILKPETQQNCSGRPGHNVFRTFSEGPAAS